MSGQRSIEGLGEIILTSTEIDEIESVVDLAIPKDVLAQVDRERAILCALKAYECRSGFGRRHIEYSTANQKACQDAIHFLLRWVFSYCHSEVVNMGQVTDIDDDTFDDLFMNAADYSLVWDVFSQWRSGWLIGSRQSDEIVLEPAPRGGPQKLGH